MKKYISILVVFMPALIICCAPPQSGQRVWNIATKNIFITQTIESKLDGLSSIDTIAGFFSDLEQLLDQVTMVESKASHLLPEIDHLQNNLIEDMSSIQQIQSDIQVISSSLMLLDLSSVFTALDALQTTIVSAMDLLNTDLEIIASTINVLAASEVQYFQTVASQLDKLDDDVAMVNSLLDGLSEQFSLATFDSITDLMQQNLATIESNVDVLADQLESGFEDTFGILDQNMLLAQTIESLADTLDVMDDSDLTGTYSLLDQLEISVQTMDSLVDLLIDTFENIESAIDVLGSALDESVSKYIFVESRTSLLIQKIEDVINSPAFSRVDQAINLLDQDISLLEHAYTADLPALTTSIESKLDNIIVQQNEQISNLDTIAAAFSRVGTISNATVDISRLSLVNSLLEDAIDDAFATESYLDSATHIEQLFAITDNTQDLQEQLSYADVLVPQISSKMLLIDDLLATTDSTLDIINATALNNLDDAITLESITDILSFGTQSSGSISSTLDVISSQEDAVISKLAIASNLIAAENSQAQDLISDFQSTWTILQVIDANLNAAYISLSLADAAMDEKFESFTFLFDTIDAIIANENTVNSQVDVYNSMVDALTNNINTDFNGVFTALDATIINADGSTTFASSMLSVISSKLPIVQTELGIPIYQRNMPLTITTPGRYYLAENINFTPASGIAITINTNNVSIDLNGKTLRYAGAGSVVTGILINNVSNTKIFNGIISNFSSDSIRTGTGQTSNIIVRGLMIERGGMDFSGTGRNHQFKNNFMNSVSTSGLITAIGTQTNIVIDNCVGIGNSVGGRAFGFQAESATIRNVQVSNCFFKYNAAAGITNGIGFNGGTSFSTLIQNNIILPVNAPINLSANAQDMTIIGNIMIGGMVAGINLNAGSLIRVNIHKNTAKGGTLGITNTVNYGGTVVITFNSLINNTSGNIRITQGLATVLGNFAFNTNAVGNPNNTNYTLPNVAHINGKFVTISQRTGISGSVAPTYWHNINMLP